MRTLLLLVFLLTFSASSTSCAQSKTTQKEKFQPTYDHMKTIVQSKSFKFIGDYVYDSKQRTKINGEANTIVINQGALSGQTSALDTPDNNIKVDGEISDYSVDFNDEKQDISIAFRSGERTFYIDIKANGYAFLAIKSGNETINQVGSLVSL